MSITPPVKTYAVTADDTGQVPIVYTAVVNHGEVTVSLRAGDTVLKAFQVGQSGAFTYSLQPDITFTIRVDVENAAGTLDLRWMQGTW